MLQEFFSTEENTRMKLFKDMMLVNWDYATFQDCVTSSNVNQHILEYGIINFYVPDDPTLKDFLMCYGRKRDILNDDGSINYQVLFNFLSAFDCGNERETRKTIGMCRQKVGITGPDIVYQTLKCITIRFRRFIHKPKWWLVYDTYYGYSYYSN